MKISHIDIQNFRSLKHASFQLSDFNVLIGQNNCGKTNFFEAIDWFFNAMKKGTSIKDLRYDRNDDNLLKVSITFKEAQAGMDLMKNAANKTKIKAALKNSDEVTIVKECVSGKRKMFVAGEEVNPGVGFDAALNDFLPKFEFITTKQYYDSVAKYAKTTPMGIMLGDVLAEILSENKKYISFQEKFTELFTDEDSQVKIEFDKIGEKVQVYLQKQFPDCSSVNFAVTAPEFDDLLKNFNTTIDDGIETLAEEKGDGMQRALMLSIIQAYADYRRSKEEPGKTFLFFIDEAELHLHPSAQRNLKNVLAELSKGNDQVFINTHSSVLVADEFDEQTIFKVEKDQGQTSINPITSREKPYIVYELLGGSPADLLMPRNFLIVEGQSEFELITNVIERHYPNEPEIQVLVAEGDIDQLQRSINNIRKCYAPLKESIYRKRLVVLLDQPSEKKKPGFKDFLDNNKELSREMRLFVLPLRDIEQCYPDIVDEDNVHWLRNQQEADAMTSKNKTQLAKRVGSRITKEDFEHSLEDVYNALLRCWRLAFD